MYLLLLEYCLQFVYFTLYPGHAAAEDALEGSELWCVGDQLTIYYHELMLRIFVNHACIVFW